MKILVLTPLYDMSNRKDLINDTSAIHYLVKYWTRDNDILVVNTYLNYKRQIFRYLKPSNIKNYINDYSYIMDNVKVYIVENQLLNSGKFQRWNWNRLKSHINKILRKENFNPDIIISHFPSFSYKIIDKLEANCKKIAVLHESDSINAKKNSNFISDLNSKFDFCFARSQKIYNEFKYNYKVENLKSEIIYSGAPIDNNKSPMIKSKRMKKKKILYAGKLIKRKNVDWIIDSLSTIDKELYEFIIIGEGPEKDILKNKINTYNLQDNIKLYGKKSREEVLNYMNEADIFCMPSVDETFGLVYIEAMSKGCLTIGTKNEGIDGVIINEENGFLIDSKENLTECLNNILLEMSEKEIEDISKSAINTAISMSEENVSKRYLELISQKF